MIGKSGDEMLTVTDKSVEYANRIVDGLLDCRREMRLEVEECSPKSLVNCVLLTIKRQH